MGYLQDFEKKLREHLHHLTGIPSYSPYDDVQAGAIEDLVKWVKDQLYQSYKNGLAAAKQGKPAKKWRERKEKGA